jgi:hypothetical protein
MDASAEPRPLRLQSGLPAFIFLWFGFQIIRRDGATPLQQGAGAALAFIGVILGAYLVWRRDGLRRRVASEAHGLGFVFSEAITGTGMGVPTYPFNGVVKRSYAEIHAGKWRGRKVLVWALEAEPNAAPGIFEVAAMHLPASLPPVEMVPRRFLGGRRAVRQDAITFESIAFDGAWSVAGRDQRIAHAIVNPRAMERLLAERKGAPSLTICGPWAYTIRKRREAHRGSLRRDLDLLADVVDLIPRHTYQQHGGWDRADYKTGADLSGSFATATREHNIFAWLAIGCAVTLLFAPLGLVVGLACLREERRKRATNHAVIITAIILNTLVCAAMVWSLAEGLTG